MTPTEIAVLVAALVAAPLLLLLNVALQRLARPDRGDRIAGCCGMALPARITEPTGDGR